MREGQPKERARSFEKNKEAQSKSLLPLKNDVIFKMVFGDERNTSILKAFLLAVLDLPEEEYDEITVSDPHLRIENPDEKLGILDVYIKTKSEKRVDVEIQIARTPFMKERITGYTGKMLGVQLVAGEGYAEMKKVITIVILAYDLIEDSQSFHNRYVLYDAKTNSLFTDIMEIHTLEMKKLPKELEPAPETDEKIKRQLLWLRLIKAEREEEVKMLATKMPEIQEAYGVLKRLSEDEEVRRLYESREKAIRDEQARLYGARTDGIKEGRIETARNLLEMEIDIDKIARAASLTLEEVQDLQNKMSVPEPKDAPRRPGRRRKASVPA
jgi:predicted transposase/invertase (TIGR01784 family)